MVMAVHKAIESVIATVRGSRLGWPLSIIAPRTGAGWPAARISNYKVRAVLNGNRGIPSRKEFHQERVVPTSNRGYVLLTSDKLKQWRMAELIVLAKPGWGIPKRRTIR